MVTRASKALVRLVMQGDKVVGEERLLTDRGERIRDVVEGPDGAIWLLTDKRATFSCTPGLQRPPPRVADTLLAAGDYIAGPYPATLEGAVRSGLAAAQACL